MSFEDLAVPFIRDVVESMLQQPEQVDRILQLLDAHEVARLINNVVKAMSDRPTTGQPDSPSGLSATTSATGSSEQGWPPTI